MATAEELAQIRALTNDTTMEDYDMSGEPRYALSDETLSAYLTLRGEGKIYGAAADALRAMAALEIRVGKSIQTEDLRTDGAKVGDALRMLADDLEAKQKQLDDDEAAADAFEIVDGTYPYPNLEW